MYESASESIHLYRILSRVLNALEKLEVYARRVFSRIITDSLRDDSIQAAIIARSSQSLDRIKEEVEHDWAFQELSRIELERFFKNRKKRIDTV